MKTIIAFLVALCSVIAVAQNKQVNPRTQCRKEAQIDTFLLPDDAAAARAAFEDLRLALLRGDRAHVIALVAFPVDLVLDGRGVKFDTAREFEKHYDTFSRHT